MPRGKQHYDPMIDEPQQIQMRGFPVAISGTYVLMDDVVTALRQYAQSLDDPVQGGAVHEAASWLQSGDRPLPEVEPPVPPEAAAPPAPENLPNVARIEVYPDDPDTPNPRWMARACDDVGRILKVTNGSFDQEYVIRDAQERWPNVETLLLREAGQDSIWEERDPGGIRSASNGRRRPSPHRMFT